MAADARVQVRELCKAYAGGEPILSDLSLTLARGEYLAIMGESGSGKSTLLNLLAGLDRPDSGEVLIDGTRISALDDDAATRLRRERIGFVFQAFHLLPYLSVAANVALPLELLREPPNAVNERVSAMLSAVGLDDRATRLPRELSGGERQRVAIARALVHRPAVVLADEPTGNLDARSAEQVLVLLRERIKAEGACGILVTHSLAAARTADRIAVLREGSLHAGARVG